MLVDDIGDVTITNDGATIVQQLALEHPAARLLVDVAVLQDREVGDGTTSVVLLAAELLRQSQQQLLHSLHPTAIIAGYRAALKHAIALLKDKYVVHHTTLTDEHLLQAARTSMSSKLIGGGGGSSSSSSDIFARIAVDAARAVQNPESGKVPLAAIHVLKAHGGGAVDDVELVPKGFCVAATVAAQGMPVSIDGASSTDGTIKIACLDMNLQRHRMGLGVSLQVTDPAEVQKIQDQEIAITKAKIQTILNAGANVVLTTKGIDDTCLKYFVEAGVMAARRCKKDDLQRLAKATGGHVVSTLADMDGEESFDVSSLGTAGAIAQVRVGDTEFWKLTDCRGSGAATIVVRGPNEYYLDEIDRALHDALCVVKRMLESSTLVAGGGAVEAAVSVALERASLERPKEQMAMQAFAEAMLIVPKTLAVNAALDASDLVAQLRSDHAAGTCHSGLDLENGTVRDNLKAGVVEPAMSKIKALRFATEAAITILRIDDRITITKQQ